MKWRWTLAIVAAFAASPASANWQYTRWGMTPAEIAAAAPVHVGMVDLPALSTPTSRVKAGAVYQASGMDFTVAFGFDAADHLNRVTLYPSNLHQCSDLNQLLRSVYGDPPPAGITTTAVATAKTWRDERGGNIIHFLIIGDWSNPSNCSVAYEPIRTREQSGL